MKIIYLSDRFVMNLVRTIPAMIMVLIVDGISSYIRNKLV